MEAKKGQWVQIHKIVLEPHERAPQVPEDTKKCPLEMWVKGYLLDDCLLNEICKIETLTGRIVEGELVSIEPRYSHNFGEYVPELDQITTSAKKLLFEKE